MKTLNSNSKKPVVRDENIEYDRQPCWQVFLTKGSSDIKNQWTVGVIYANGSKQQYSFKFSEISNDPDVYTKMKSEHFGIKLLTKFKYGGQGAVKKWLKDGHF